MLLGLDFEFYIEIYVEKLNRVLKRVTSVFKGVMYAISTNRRYMHEVLFHGLALHARILVRRGVFLLYTTS